MKTPRIANAIGHIDDDLVSNSVESKKKKNNHWVKWGSLAACFALLIIAGTFFIQYIPTEYDLNYSYIGSDGQEMIIADKSVWIYYIDGGNIKHERVKLPCTAENIFITWKHLNNIGSEVELLEYEIVSNDSESTSEFEDEGVANYKPGDYFVLNITISDNLNSYDNQVKLIESLKKTMTDYSNIDFDEVNVIFK